MSAKIRLGIVGANSHAGWVNQTHLPAVLSSPEFELAGVCTTRQESADESASLYGAKMAFHDYRDLVAHPDIDAIAVVVRAPSHFAPTKEAINAGKPVYTEWPLGRTTTEAIELAQLANNMGVVTAAGLQGRVHPTIMYMKDLIEDGYVGEIMTCNVSLIYHAVLQRPANRIWQHDASLGGNTLTIANGHTIDTLTYLVGDIRAVSSIVSTQNRTWFLAGSSESVDVDAPDTVVTAGKLYGGGVVSLHVAATTCPGSGFHLEIYGDKGRLTAAGNGMPQSSDLLLSGAKGNDALVDMPVPSRYVFVPPTMPRGYAFNVGQLYHQFARSIRQGDGNHPNFNDAVGLHRLLDDIKLASDSNREVER